MKRPLPEAPPQVSRTGGPQSGPPRRFTVCCENPFASVSYLPTQCSRREGGATRPLPGNSHPPRKLLINIDNFYYCWKFSSFVPKGSLGEPLTGGWRHLLSKPPSAYPLPSKILTKFCREIHIIPCPFRATFFKRYPPPKIPLCVSNLSFANTIAIRKGGTASVPYWAWPARLPEHPFYSFFEDATQVTP